VKEECGCMAKQNARFEEVYNKYKSMISAICYTYTKNLSDTEDLVQDIFMKYHTKQPKFESVDHMKHWFIRVAIHMSINHVKSSWKKKVHFDSNIVNNAHTEKQKNEDEFVFDLVHALPNTYKDVVILFYYENISISDVSKALGKSQYTIKKRLERARNIIKTKMEEAKND